MVDEEENKKKMGAWRGGGAFICVRSLHLGIAASVEKVRKSFERCLRGETTRRGQMGERARR